MSLLTSPFPKFNPATYPGLRTRPKKPLVIDLFCGLGGWADGFLVEGYDVIGFDIERHDYGTGGYPGQLVLQDVLTLHGSQFKDAAVIVASPPCQEYSYMAMPWSRGKQIRRALLGEDTFPLRYKGSRDVKDLTALFEACFRIAKQAGVPLVVENVKGAQPWVGPSKGKYNNFHLWGDVPELPLALGKGFKGFKGFKREWREREASHRYSSHSKERCEWSAQIAKIPFPLACYIARHFYP